MADNFVTNAGSGGATFGSDELTIGGVAVQVPRVKLVHGADGTYDGDVGSASPLPVTDSTATTALQIIDDWDESDRAKVNLIVGQAGIAADAGVVGVTVPRVTLASNDPAVTALQLIDNAVSGAGFNITQLGGAAVPIGAGVEATALRVTIATDSTGTLSIDDGGGAITVDGTVGVSGSVAVTGTFWQTTQPVSIAGTVTVDLGTNNDVTVTGTVAVTQSGSWNIGTVTTLTTCSTVTNLAQLGGQAVSMGTGVRDAGTQRVTLATDDSLTVDLGTNNDVAIAPRTSGGYSISRTIGAATTNATSVKSSAGQVYGIYVSNINAAAVYLKLYDKASAPTVGTDTPVATFMVPGAAAGAGFTFWPPAGIEFSTGIAFAVTGVVGDADTTAVSANEQVVHVFYS